MTAFDDKSPEQPPDQDGGGGHGWMMVACCIPMIVIAVVLVATGVAGAGFILIDRKSTRLNSSHIQKSRMPSSA